MLNSHQSAWSAGHVSARAPGRKLLHASIIAGLMCFASPHALAQSAPDGVEFIAPATTLNYQALPSVARLTGGGFVVAWTDLSGTAPGANAAEVFVQRYDATGARVGAETVVNTERNDYQQIPVVAGLSDGGFIVTWSDSNGAGALGDGNNEAVLGQFYDNAGVAVGVNFLIPTLTSDTQGDVSIGTLSDGGFVIVWSDLSNGNADDNNGQVRGQRYDNTFAVAGAEFLVNTTTASIQSRPSVAGLAGGGFVVVWQDASQTGGDADNHAIRGQVYDGAFTPSGGEFLVNTTTTNSQLNPEVTALTGGGFVVVWEDSSEETADADLKAILARGYDAAFDPVGNDFLINETHTAGNQKEPDVFALDDGGFVVTWNDDSQFDSASTDIRARQYTSAFTPADDEFLVNTTLLGTQEAPVGVSIAADEYVILWTDASKRGDADQQDDVRGQLFSYITPALIVANDRVIDAFVTPASDFGGSGTSEIASAIDFDAVDITGDLEFAVVVQNVDQFDGYDAATMAIELEGAVFDGFLTSSNFSSGGACVFAITGGGLDGGASVTFATADLEACDDEIVDRDYTNGGDDDMVFNLPIRLTGTEVNFSIELTRNGDTVIGSDVQDNDDLTDAIDPIATGIDDVFSLNTFGNAARTVDNPLGEGAERLATLASDYNALDNDFVGTLEGTQQGLVYFGGAFVAADISSHVDELVLTVTVDDATGLEGMQLVRGGHSMDAAFNGDDQAVFTINGASDVDLSDVENGVDIFAVADADADTQITRTGVSTSVVAAFAAGMGLADASEAGGIDQIGREGSTEGPFEWVGDATRSTANIFRVTGLGDTLPSFWVELDGSSAGLDGSYALSPSGSVNNGELLITIADVQNAVGQAFGRADVSFFVEADGITIRRLMVTNGVVTENSTDF